MFIDRKFNLLFSCFTGMWLVFCGSTSEGIRNHRKPNEINLNHIPHFKVLYKGAGKFSVINSLKISFYDKNY